MERIPILQVHFEQIKKNRKKSFYVKLFIIRLSIIYSRLDTFADFNTKLSTSRTIVTNPAYMKDGFHIKIETLHAQDGGTQPNAHCLNQKQLIDRKVVVIDIANDTVSSGQSATEGLNA